ENTISDSSKDWVTFGAAQDKPYTSTIEGEARKMPTTTNKTQKFFNLYSNIQKGNSLILFDENGFLPKKHFEI
ncbi:MAG: hypothetical protein OES14_05615, partial [Nitrosopumilus sp.]|nr:hypothetical protein [Nitrosopumilus sp.]